MMMDLFLKLVGEKITQSLGHRVPAGPEGEPVHLHTEWQCTHVRIRRVHFREEVILLRGVVVPAPVRWAPVAAGSRPACSWCEWRRRPRSWRGLDRRRPAGPRQSPGSEVTQRRKQLETLNPSAANSLWWPERALNHSWWEAKILQVHRNALGWPSELLVCRRRPNHLTLWSWDLG